MLTLCVLTALLPQNPGTTEANAVVVINEVNYDNPGQDNREYIELYNTSSRELDVEGWSVEVHNPFRVEGSHPIPAGTTISPRGFFVIGSSNVPEVDLPVGTSGLWSNIVFSVNLHDETGRLVDSVLIESEDRRRSPSMFGEGDGIWGVQTGGPTMTGDFTFQRWTDGYDTGNNGRDFTLKRATPGAPNAFKLRLDFENDFDALPTNTPVPGWDGGVLPMVGDPRLVDPMFNPQSIPAPSGNAMFVGSAGHPGNTVWQTADPCSRSWLSLSLYLDDSPLPSGRREATTITFGTGDGASWLPDDARFPMATRANNIGNVGWDVIFHRDDSGSWWQVVDRGDGGDYPGTPNFTRTWGDQDIHSTGWHDIFVMIDGNEFTAEVNGTRIDAIGATAPGTWRINYATNVSPSSPDAAMLRPPTLDNVSIQNDSTGFQRIGNAVPLGNGQTPLLGISEPPAFGASGFGFELDNLVPNSNAVTHLGPVLQSPLGLGPFGAPLDAALYVGGIAFVASATDASGHSSVPLPLPNTPDIISFELGAQAFQLDASRPELVPIVHPQPVEIAIGRPRSGPGAKSATVLTGPIPEQEMSRLQFAANVPVELSQAQGEVTMIRIAPPTDATDPYVPMQDFHVERFQSGAVEVTLVRPGVYIIEVNYDLPTRTRLFSACCEADPFEGERRQPETRYEVLPGPPAHDLAIVELGQPGDNRANQTAREILSGEEVVATVDDAAASIVDASNVAGRPIDVLLVGHGRPGVIKVGAGQTDGPEKLDFQELGVAGSPVERFIQQTRGKIRCLFLWGCRIGAGTDGPSFLQQLDDRLTAPGVDVTVKAYDQTVCGRRSRRGSPARFSITEGATIVRSQ